MLSSSEYRVRFGLSALWSIVSIVPIVSIESIAQESSIVQYCSQLFLPIMSPLQVILVLRCPDHIKAVIAAGSHLFPSRTEKLSPLAPMVLHTRGRVGSRHFSEEALAEQSAGAFFVKGRAAYSPAGLCFLVNLCPSNWRGMALMRCC